MNALIIGVGKLRERWQREACAEYLKRLSRYGKYEVIELDDEPEPEKPAPALNKRIMDAEGERILKRLRPEDYLIALCVDGRAPDSVELSRETARWAGSGRKIAFVIGGSLGLSENVLARADERISFSRLTFPHQLMRVILLEQLYRSARILSGERYHK